MKTKIEHKRFPFNIEEIKASDDGNRATFKGYASTFGNKDLGGDVVQKGAFANSIKKQSTVILLSDHTATIKSNIGFGFDLSEDDNGLLMTAELNLEKEAGRETYAMLKHASEVGYKVGLSIGYSVNDYEWDEKNRIRTIKDVDLWEVSTVIFPMNPKATVTGLKSILKSGNGKEIAELKRQIENLLRDEVGFSCKEAETFVSVGFGALRDEDRDAAAKAIVELTNRIKKTGE